MGGQLLGMLTEVEGMLSSEVLIIGLNVDASAVVFVLAHESDADSAPPSTSTLLLLPFSARALRGLPLPGFTWLFRGNGEDVAATGISSSPTMRPPSLIDPWAVDDDESGNSDSTPTLS